MDVVEVVVDEMEIGVAVDVGLVDVVLEDMLVDIVLLILTLVVDEVDGD